MNRKDKRIAAAHVKQRDAILISGDLTAMKKFYHANGGPPLHETAYEIMFHKCRCEVPAIPQELRNASAQWLADHGYSRLGGTRQ